MKIYTTCILLVILVSGGCPFYDFDLIALKVPDENNNNNFKLEADLNSQINQDLLKIHLGPKAQRGAGKYSLMDSKPTENKNIAVKQVRDASKNILGTCTKLKNFVGTNLFDGNRKKCFSSEDVAVLTARRDFESLIPKDLPQCLLNDEMVSMLMQYFHSGNKIIQRMSDECSKRLTEKAFYDTLGGYLRSYVVPVTKFSFYAGQVNLKTMENVIDLYQQCKTFLNTNGNGWKAPVFDLLNDMKNIKIQPLKITDDPKDNEGPACCAHLDLSSVNNDGEDEQMIVSLPKLEFEECDGYLNNIWLPFKRKRTFNLRSTSAAFIIVKFYETVTRCYRFQNMCQDTYNHKFKEWILEYVQIHLSDEQLYPGFGAILKIYENLRRGKKSVDFNEERNYYNDNLPSDDEIVVDEQENINENEDEQNFKKYENLHNEINGFGIMQNTFEFSGNERTSKQINGKNIYPFEKVFPRGNNSKNEHKVKCGPKRKKNKPKCKPKGKKGSQKSSSSPENYHLNLKIFDPAKQRVYLKYLLYMIIIILLILLLVFLCAILMRLLRRFKQKKAKEPQLPFGSPITKKKRRLCDRFRRRKRSIDEEILIKSNSKSVIQTRQPTTSTSTSSLACHLKTKCIPCTKKNNKNCESAVIETTSIDCSSSGIDEKKRTFQKIKPKVVTINEKQGRSLSPKKQRTSSKSSSSNSKIKCFNRIGLQRSTGTDADSFKECRCEKKKPRKKSNTSSWETMFDT